MVSDFERKSNRPDPSPSRSKSRTFWKSFSRFLPMRSTMTNMRKVEIDPEVLRRARSAVGITLDEAARQSRIPRGTVAALEARPRLELDRAKRLAKVLRVRLGELCVKARGVKT